MKFKNQEALYNAYVELEREFTKKCQLLKETEGQLHALQNANGTNADNFAVEADIALQQPSCYASPQGLEAFFELIPQAQAYAEDINRLLSDNPSDMLDCYYRAYLQAAGQLVPPSALAENDNFLADFIYNNPKVLKKTMELYLSKQGEAKQALPQFVFSAGSMPLTPQKRPKTIEDANKMANFYLSK